VAEQSPAKLPMLQRYIDTQLWRTHFFLCSLSLPSEITWMTEHAHFWTWSRWHRSYIAPKTTRPSRENLIATFGRASSCVDAVGTLRQKTKASLADGNPRGLESAIVDLF
jgi:hypothetical protein